MERQDRQLYVLCKLGSWVNIQQLRAVAVVSRQEVKAAERSFGSGINPVVPQAVAKSSVHSSKKRLAIETLVSMVKRPTTGLLSDSQLSATPVSATPVSASQPQSAEPDLPIDGGSAPRTSAEIFDNVRNQYFEALYLSKVGYMINSSVSKTNEHRVLWHTLLKARCHEPVHYST